VLATQKRATPFPTADPSAVDEAEAALGFRIPDLLKAIYLNVGNGGFGPEGGTIIGLRGGFEGSAGDLVAEYNDVQRGAEYLGWEWRDGLLPFCDWGCGTCTCVDCNDPRGRIFLAYQCDPFRQRYDLEGFVKRWLKGVDSII
jgi:hypothetical protein